VVPFVNLFPHFEPPSSDAFLSLRYFVLPYLRFSLVPPVLRSHKSPLLLAPHFFPPPPPPPPPPVCPCFDALNGNWPELIPILRRQMTPLLQSPPVLFYSVPSPATEVTLRIRFKKFNYVLVSASLLDTILFSSPPASLGATIFTG